MYVSENLTNLFVALCIAVAQRKILLSWLEQRNHNPWVGGSSPSLTCHGSRTKEIKRVVPFLKKIISKFEESHQIKNTVLLIA